VKIEVVFATLAEQNIVALELAENSTVLDAVRLAGHANNHPEIETGKTPVGIYGERVQYDTILQDGDRVEIYRPLAVDPMQARRLRAQAQANIAKRKK